LRRRDWITWRSGADFSQLNHTWLSSNDVGTLKDKCIVCVQPFTAAVNATLLAFAADHRAAVRCAAAPPLLLGACCRRAVQQ